MSEAQASALKNNGFVAIDHFVKMEEVKRLRSIYDRLFESGAGSREGVWVNLSGVRDAVAAVQALIAGPYGLAPELTDCAIVRNARDVAKSAFGDDLLDQFSEHMVFKPAGASTESPLQATTYYDPTLIVRNINFWIPLYDAIDNARMYYVPGSHRSEVLPHHSFGSDARVHGMEVTNRYRELAVPCPIGAGGCILHLPTTLHFATANPAPSYRRACTLIMHAVSRRHGKLLNNISMWEKTHNLPSRIKSA